jgi:hypothetical protein
MWNNTAHKTKISNEEHIAVPEIDFFPPALLADMASLYLPHREKKD